MDDVFDEVQHKIRMKKEARLREQARCADICKEKLEGAVMSKYASRKECEAARTMAKAIMAAITLDEKAANVQGEGAAPLLAQLPSTAGLGGKGDGDEQHN